MPKNDDSPFARLGFPMQAAFGIFRPQTYLDEEEEENEGEEEPSSDRPVEAPSDKGGIPHA